MVPHRGSESGFVASALASHRGQIGGTSAGLGLNRNHGKQNIGHQLMQARNDAQPGNTVNPIRDEYDQLVRIVSAGITPPRGMPDSGKKKEEDLNPCVPIQYPIRTIIQP